MRTNISIYHAAEKLAEELGISLSELYTAACTAYISEYESEVVTEKPEGVYRNELSTIDSELIKMQIDVLEYEQS